MLFVAWYVVEQQDQRNDKRMTERYGRSWEKYKQEQVKNATEKMIQSLGNTAPTPYGFRSM